MQVYETHTAVPCVYVTKNTLHDNTFPYSAAITEVIPPMKFNYRDGGRGNIDYLILPAEIRGHHAEHIDPVTQLQGDGHGEPARTQPGVRTLPERRMHLLRQSYKRT